MHQDKFAAFSEAYARGLADAVANNPDDYALAPNETPESYASRTAAKMLAAVATKPYGVSYDGGGFKRACKALGIKHTRKAIFEYLGIGGAS